MHKRQATIGLVIASIMSLNTLPTIAVLNEENNSNILNEEDVLTNENETITDNIEDSLHENSNNESETILESQTNKNACSLDENLETSNEEKLENSKEEEISNDEVLESDEKDKIDSSINEPEYTKNDETTSNEDTLESIEEDKSESTKNEDEVEDGKDKEESTEDIDEDEVEDDENKTESTEDIEEDKTDSNEEDNEEENNQNKELITFKDLNLIKSINTILKKDDLTSSIYKDEINNIKELNLSKSNIKDLSGLEYFSQLEILDISNNNISDISPLSSLKELKKITANNNNITDTSPLNNLTLNNADFSNQNIYLDDTKITDTTLNISNPIKSINGLKLAYEISHNGYTKEDSFVWDELYDNNYDLKIVFKGELKNFKFSGTISQKLTRDESLTNNIKIELIPETKEWINSDLKVYYNIKGIPTSLIKNIQLPNNLVKTENEGYFKVDNNGKHTIKVNLKNGETFEQSINIKNIDKNKPIFNIIKQSIKNNIVTVNIEVTDTDSGLNYIQLPNKEKLYNTNSFEYSFKTSEVVDFIAFDIAGNKETLTFSANDYVNKYPVIIALDRKIELGEKFNPLLGVEAFDYKGYNITNNIKVVSNNVNTEMLGEYLVTYSVVDSRGYESFKTIKVEVIDNTNNKKEPSQNNTEYNELAGTNNDTELYGKEEDSKDGIFKNTYLTAIVASMLSGFIFLFKSGKDNF